MATVRFKFSTDEVTWIESLHESAKGIPPTPAVAVTAYVGATARAEAQRAGFAAYLSKPTPPGEVLDAILQSLTPTRGI